ncbi:TetR/AcrR family transcriptional regulator [Aestuariibacter sp. A3R04]|uniref:TetR/AcrR family transcriptional regulator n=1 Tax=Aestuariibacter sp. A3R04 TaxID=2841571 RepID=UPI001C0880BC|nr:TetR/AcrR family transcriptional regulator [Aestuariibacter sp. A3R04]MBU3023164.1 TetR/AcrR family transcriptional regulator [Aestuariibacter sp. A3R04]
MSDSKLETSRERILKAATAIAVEDGPKQLTLDNVAKKCGMSKGGLIHHFPNKDALLTEMLACMMKTMNSDMEHVRDQHSDVLTITTMMRSRKLSHEKLLLQEAKVLLVAAIENPDLLAPMCHMMTTKKDAIFSEPHTDKSLLLWLAADGLSFQELLGVSPFDENERSTLRNKLIDMAVALEDDQGE